MDLFAYWNNKTKVKIIKLNPTNHSIQDQPAGLGRAPPKAPFPSFSLKFTNSSPDEGVRIIGRPPIISTVSRWAATIATVSSSNWILRGGSKIGHRLTWGMTLRSIPIVGGTFVTVMRLTPGINRTSVFDTSGVLALGRTSVDGDALTGFCAIFRRLELDLS